MGGLVGAGGVSVVFPPGGTPKAVPANGGDRDRDRERESSSTNAAPVITGATLSKGSSSILAGLGFSPAPPPSALTAQKIQERHTEPKIVGLGLGLGVFPDLSSPGGGGTTSSAHGGGTGCRGQPQQVLNSLNLNLDEAPVVRPEFTFAEKMPEGYDYLERVHNIGMKHLDGHRFNSQPQSLSSNMGGGVNGSGGEGGGGGSTGGGGSACAIPKSPSARGSATNLCPESSQSSGTASIDEA